MGIAEFNKFNQTKKSETKAKNKLHL